MTCTFKSAIFVKRKESFISISIKINQKRLVKDPYKPLRSFCTIGKCV